MFQKRVFQLVSILHGAVIITLQTVSHFAVQRVSCVMMLSEATMVIAKGRTTNLGRGGVWNSVHFLPFFFHTFILISFSSFSLSIPVFVCFFLIPSLSLTSFLSSLYPLLFLQVCLFPCSCTTYLLFFLFCFPLFCFESLGIARTLTQVYIKC